MRPGSIVLCVAACLVAGCSVKRVPPGDPGAKPPPPEAPPYDYRSEGTVPEPPPGTPEPASGRAPQSEKRLETPEAADLHAPAVRVEDLPGAAPPPAAPPAPVLGYRAQVFASTDVDAAQRLRTEVEARLGERAYVEFESPYHKVRVGNCPDSDACRRLMDRLRQAGYESVWLVQTPIEP